MIPMLALKLLGIGKWLREAATGVLGLVRRYPLQAALIVSVCLSVWLWKGRQSARADAAKAERELSAQIAAYEKAQADAKAAQDHADQINLAMQVEHNRSLAREHASNEAARVAAVADYIAGHRLPRTAQGSASGPGAAGVHSDPEAPDGTSSGPDMVAVPASDLDKLSKAALQNAERGQYLSDLVAMGLAVVGE